MANIDVLLIAAALGGYLLGSIPFGLVLTKLFSKQDIRKIGSGNIGATNVLRSGSKGLALATLLLDGGKGLAAVLLAKQFGLEAALLAGFGAFIGHLYPVWLKFKGGKGVATFFGILFGLAWPVALMAVATWLLTALVTRYSSLAALIAAILAPLYAWLTGYPTVVLLATVLMALIVWRHRENIQRLLDQTESKIGKS